MHFELCDRGVQHDRPMIYMWEILRDGLVVGRYVGQSKNGTDRAIREYENNVRKLVSGEPYRKSRPDQFRRIHRALAEASQNKNGSARITLFLLCNVPEGADINEYERYYSKYYQTNRTTTAFGLNG